MSCNNCQHQGAQSLQSGMPPRLLYLSCNKIFVSQLAHHSGDKCISTHTVISMPCNSDPEYLGSWQFPQHRNSAR
eukprot:scaffold187982_cov31-Prasinocladus_malaysianus.AAC.1